MRVRLTYKDGRTLAWFNVAQVEFLDSGMKVGWQQGSAGKVSVHQVPQEGREGMVTVYDHEGRYLGCMGIDAWRESLEVSRAGSLLHGGVEGHYLVNKLAATVRRGLHGGERLVPGTMSQEEFDGIVALDELVALAKKAEGRQTRSRQHEIC